MADTEKVIAHPLEAALGIEIGTTVVPTNDVMSLPAVIGDDRYDPKDREIDGQFEEVYSTALSAATILTEEIEVGDPRFRNRSAEVAAQLLNTALAAAKEKSNLKQHKDKLAPSNPMTGGGGNVGTINNNIIADRNFVLRAMQGMRNEEVLDVLQELRKGE